MAQDPLGDGDDPASKTFSTRWAIPNVGRSPKNSMDR